MAGRLPPPGSRENGPNAAQGALVLGWLFTTWAIFGLFAEPDKFTFTDSLLLIMILVNVFNSIKELIRNKRIAAEKNAVETSEDAPVAK